MILKSHISGVAIVYEDNFTKSNEPKHNFFAPPQQVTGRVQGSLYSQHKRKIADACEYMRLHAIHKPLIFTATSPGFTDLANERKLITKLTHNLRNGYDCKNYVWVREFTQAGFPHFHFVADIPDINPIALSSYWSGLFNRTDTNSIRLGTGSRCNRCRTPLHKGQPCYRPKCKGKGIVKYYLDNNSMAWYMSKYIGKSIGGLEKMALDEHRERGKSFRTFAVSQELARLSVPAMYNGTMERTGKIRQAFNVYGGYTDLQVDKRIWRNDNQTLSDSDLQRLWKWKYTGFSSTFKGYPKEWKFRKKKE